MTAVQAVQLQGKLRKEEEFGVECEAHARGGAAVRLFACTRLLNPASVSIMSSSKTSSHIDWGYGRGLRCPRHPGHGPLAAEAAGSAPPPEDERT